MLDFLLGKWDAACRRLDSAEAEYIASGFTRRPQHRPGRWCCCKGAPAPASVAPHYRPEYVAHSGVRQSRCDGVGGVVICLEVMWCAPAAGVPVDSINTYASEVRVLEAKVLAEQQTVLQVRHPCARPSMSAGNLPRSMT